MSDQFKTKRVMISDFTKAQRLAALERTKTKLTALGWEFVEFKELGILDSYATFKAPMSVQDNQMQGVLLTLGVLFIGILLGAGMIKGCTGDSDGNSTTNVASTENKTTYERPYRPKEEVPVPSSAEYSKTIRQLIREEFRTADAHLAIEGSTKWLFVTLSYSEWRTVDMTSQREFVNLLLQHMRKAYGEDSGNFMVSVSRPDAQALAEGKWWRASHSPKIEILVH